MEKEKRAIFVIGKSSCSDNNLLDYIQSKFLFPNYDKIIIFVDLSIYCPGHWNVSNEKWMRCRWKHKLIKNSAFVYLPYLNVLIVFILHDIWNSYFILDFGRLINIMRYLLFKRLLIVLIWFLTFLFVFSNMDYLKLAFPCLSMIFFILCNYHWCIYSITVQSGFYQSLMTWHGRYSLFLFLDLEMSHFLPTFL